MDSGEYEPGTPWDEAMDEFAAEGSDVEVRRTPETSDDARDSGSGDGREPSGSPSSDGNAAARFLGISRGPLGAAGIVSNRQTLHVQGRQIEDFIRSMQADVGQASTANERTGWAGVNAGLERLIKGKTALREHVEGITERTRARDDKFGEWAAKFATLADVESHRLVSMCDKLPPNMGPALLRLVAFYFQDDDSLDRLPRKYKDLIRQDAHLLAQKALPPAPSQDVTVLRKELATVRADDEAKRRAVNKLKDTVSELEADQATWVSAQEYLETKINNLMSRYEAASVRLGERINEEEQKKSHYKQRLRESNETCGELNTMLVQAEEEKGGLSVRVSDALRSIKEKDARIKELDEYVKAFTAVDEGSRSALDVLKVSFDLLREQKNAAESLHEKMVAELQEKSQSRYDAQQRKINQLRGDVTKLERENGRIRQLEGEKHDLQQVVTELTARNQTLSTELEAGAAREKAASQDKRELEERMSGLRRTSENLQARFDELGASYGRLQTDKADVQKKLDMSEEERSRVQARLDVASKDINSLRAEAQGDKAAIDRLRGEKTNDHEKISGLKGKLRDVNAQLTVQETNVTRLGEQLSSKEDEVTKLLADVARLGMNEEQYNRSIALEHAKGEKLQAQVSDAEGLLATEQQRVSELSKEKEELSTQLRDEKARVEGLKGSVSEQRRQAGDSRRELLAAIDKEKDRAQQLQVTVTELKSSVQSLQNEKVQSARSFGALDASRTKLLEDIEAKNSTLGQLRAQNSSLEAEASRLGSEVARLSAQLSLVNESASRAGDRAEESVRELRGFLSRLCLVPPRDPAVFEGLARQLQVPGLLEAQAPAGAPGWAVLETWGDEAVEEAVNIPEGLEMLVLELYRAAVAEDICTRKCHQALLRAVEAVSEGTVIHGGVFVEMARVFVQVVVMQPYEAFEVGLVFWQLLDVVQRRWSPASLDTARGRLEDTLKANPYAGVFEVVARRGQFRECDDCHFFSDTIAVFTRDSQPRAMLVNVKEQSVRFFSKSRIKAGLYNCTVKPLGDHPVALLPINCARDVAWTFKMA